MGRPRAFDEDEVIAAAAVLFASRAYDGVSVDDLVGHLGVHRNSLYKVFGSKRGLYLAALRRHLDEILVPALHAGQLTAASPELDLLLLAAVERAAADTDVGALVHAVLHEVDAVLGAEATSALLGARLRARASASAGAQTAAEREM
jgi:AcrR family transcriptional regulator